MCLLLLHHLLQQEVDFLRKVVNRAITLSHLVMKFANLFLKVECVNLIAFLNTMTFMGNLSYMLFLCSKQVGSIAVIAQLYWLLWNWPFIVTAVKFFLNISTELPPTLLNMTQKFVIAIRSVASLAHNGLAVEHNQLYRFLLQICCRSCVECFKFSI